MVRDLSGISTHVLDTALGKPATGVPVTLEREVDGRWQQVAAVVTDADGRVRQLLPEGSALVEGVYRIVFETDAYFEARRMVGLYPLVEIRFTVRDADGHYHIPLLLTANGYSTYRGS